MASVLVVDDDRGLCCAIEEIIASQGHRVQTVFSCKEAVGQMSETTFDLIFLDVRLPDGDGLAFLSTIRGANPPPEVIVITGSGDPDGAEVAMRNGAWDYVEKPFTKQEIVLQLSRALDYRKEKYARKHLVALKLDGIVGRSPELKSCLDLVAAAANSEAAVLASGETGTGKELLARAIHMNSPRAGKSFIVVDCASLPQTLVESILFGHVKGAFSGADQDRQGLIQMSNGGTLFLDEVGELPVSVQEAFLRVLQDGSFRQVGGKEEIRSDFRIIAATNKDLDVMGRSGEFREDLLYRIRTINIHVPPLRDRVQDIDDLLSFHLKRLCKHYGLGLKGYDPTFVEALESYQWPGNAREFVHALDAAISVAWDEPILYPVHLPVHIRMRVARDSLKSTPYAPVTEDLSVPAELPTLHVFRESMEKKYLGQLMDKTNHSLQDACKFSGLSRSRLYVLVKKHHIPFKTSARS